MRKTPIIFIAIALIATAVAIFFSSYKKADAPSSQTSPFTIVQKSSNPKLRNPSDIIFFQGKYVATELMENKLAIFDDLSLTNLKHFDPKTIKQAFNSPHFLAISPGNSLLISNGWGESIVEVQDLQGTGWKEFSGLGKPFNAPHGLCVDREGWIYVGDSLNSRLVRFKDMQGKDWQVFPDIHKKISYIRELVCEDGVVWVSNSYENRPGLNPGVGANILKIEDFESGITEEIVNIKDTNFTGVIPLKNKLIVGLWSKYQSLAIVDSKLNNSTIVKESNFGFGTPYGTFNDLKQNLQVITYFGSIEENSNNLGGLVIIKTAF